ncbi:MAG TPA: YhdP family protein [Nitrococcus sp.]|nr:YhdP family protein [Nitrococcus sp.]
MASRTAERICTGLLKALAAALVAAAIALAVLRLAVAYAPAFHGQIQALLAHWLDRPVAIATLDARLIGFTPELILHGVRIGGGLGRPPDLTAARLEVSIDPWQTLRSLGLRLAELSIDKLTVTLTRRADGRIVLGEEANRPSGPLLASISGLRLRDASVRLIDQRRAAIWRLQDLQARFWGAAEVHHLAARFTPVQPRLAQQVELALSWHGESRALAESNATGYLHLLAARFDRISAALPPAWSVPVASGQGDARIWVSLRRGKLEEVAVDTSMRDLGFGSTGAVRLQRLAGRGHWERSGAGWNLDINDLRLQRPDGLAAPPSDLSIRYSTGAGGAELWRARASSLRLGDLAALVQTNEWLPLKWRERIVQLAPRGEVCDAALVIQSANQERHWRLSGRFQGFAVQPAERLPGLSAGVGRFLLTDRGGRVRLDARDASLMLPELLPRAVALARLRLQSEWRLADGRLQLVVPRLQASSSAGELDAQLGLWLGGRQGPFIEARARLRHGDASQIRQYLPERIMAKRLSEWLHNAIRAGHVQADLVLRGLARDFPYRKGEGVFDVEAQVDDLDFAYYPGWPALAGVSGRLSFHGGEFTAEIDSARLYRSRLLHAMAAIPDLARPRLTVRGRFAGPGDDLVRFLRESPLGHERAALRQISLAGQQRLDLQLVFPFGGRPIEVAGGIDLRGARLAANKLGLAIDDLTGHIDFDTDGVGWDRLRGRFDGQPLVSQAMTSGPPGARRIRIDTRFRSSLAGLLGTDSSLAARFPGTADWRLEIDSNGFRAAEGLVNVTLESELRGVQVNLPQPFAKPASVSRRLSVQAQLDSTGLEPIRVYYAQAGSAVLALAPHTWTVERLGVHLGSGKARLPRRPGTWLTGTLAQLDLAGLTGWRPGGQPIALPPLRVVDLQIGTCSWARTELVRALRISARRRADGWFANLTGPDLAGWIHWPQNGQDRVLVNLARLHLTGWPEFDAGRARLQARSLNLPGIDLDIADLRVAGGDFGHFSMRLSRMDGALVLETMHLTGPLLEAKAAGRWDAGGQRGRSAVDLSVRSKDTGKALALFGFATAIDNGKTRAQAHLQWPGGLLDFGSASVAGEVQFTVRDGSLLQIQPGVGRIFGLLSVATLPRRLTLDFSDLFGKGLAFDRIKAAFRLENGTARPEIFYIDSPAARIEVSGPIDLVRRQYDQTVTVMPHFSSAVSLLGGLAGGPLAGVILFLTQKLLLADMEQLAQNHYRITGSWEHPRIESTEGTRAEAPGVMHDTK